MRLSRVHGVADAFEEAGRNTAAGSLQRARAHSPLTSAVDARHVNACACAPTAKSSAIRLTSRSNSGLRGHLGADVLEVLPCPMLSLEDGGPARSSRLLD